LTTALALQHRGLEAQVYEQAEAFTEVGAGLGLGLNAVRILDRLGLEAALDRIAFHVRGYEMRRWRDGDVIVQTHHDAPPPSLRAHEVHRGELLNLLLDAIDERRLHAGKRCVNVADHGDQVRLDFADGSAAMADVVVGADGIHSVVRALHHADQPVFSGMAVYRGLIPMERLDFLGYQREIQTFWLGPRRHLLIYPVSAGRLMNLVAFVPADGEEVRESWSATGDVDRLAEHFRGWENTVTRVIRSLDGTMRWALYEREPLRAWSFGRTTLLGDAAHAMQPHTGQGAGQSIEDAAVLARCLAEARPATLSRWLTLYEEVRKPRTRRVQEASRRAGEIYEMVDEQQQRRLAPDALRGRGNWIWGYDLDQAFEDARAALVAEDPAAPA
ncbi:MAG: FAD-dependent monooxygenase, partial [Candidatus Dormibacteraeota bacterium]|nr:FAD-dependent monooxygenase [Candidatus Dormibacteraeota bacterium]